MLILFIARIRDKVMLLLRFLLFLSILFIIVMQIFSTIADTGWPENLQHDDPSGKPMRVEEKRF